MSQRFSLDPPVAPGTVSRILWHFTGGPEWDQAQRRQKSSPKPSRQAYKNLKSILRTTELRVGGYKEIVRVIVPKRRRYNASTRRIEIEENVPVEISSVPVCCLSDIPAAHLGYHSYRYGKFAIGFHRAAAVAHGFNPVFYTLEDANVIRSIHRGFSDLESVDIGGIGSTVDDAELELDDLSDGTDADGVRSRLDDVRSETDTAITDLESAKDNLERFLAFVKTFQKDEFGTIYCEREWRSVSTYAFTIDDVAMIVVPRNVGDRRYFDDFVRKAIPRLRISPTVPVVPWEDLVEH